MTAEITPETINLALEGADFLHSHTTPRSKMEAVAIRQLVAHATETCEWKEDEEGAWFAKCGEAFILSIGTPTENEYHYCPNCGKHIVEKPFALTETKQEKP